MAVFKCKMCGGSLEIAEGCSVAECEYCGTTQTVPSADNEKKMTLFTRANRLRFTCEFDKAAGIYESIIAEFPEEAEAYWGLVLCKYGIEYVDDPATAAKVPTCHRSAFESVLDDSNFELVMEYADSAACAVYRSEAKKIEELRKGIIEVSSKEEPYDIFICYKETDEKGDRTVDSLIAQDTYNALTEKGYRVFFSRITLEDKLGQEYEPYIFAALNSAKVMLAFGTCYEHFNAVWVKNEWSRFLQLMAKGEKKTLIPCYKNLDAYDIPKEFAKLQAQDMGKVGALQDLLRGIEKIIPLANEQKVEAVRPTVVANTATVDSLLKRVEIFLGDQDWNSAEEYCEKVLDIDPENAQAYLGELMAALRVSKKSELANCKLPFDTHRNYEKVLRYGDEALVSQLKGYITHINARNKEEQQNNAYNKARHLMQSANTEDGYMNAADAFTGILDYRDAADLRQMCFEKAEAARKDSILKEAKAKLSENSKSACEYAIGRLKTIPGWKDADDLIDKFRSKIEEIKAKEAEAARQAELERAELARQSEIKRIEDEKRAKKNKKVAMIVTPIVFAAIAFVIVLITVIIPNGKYEEAVASIESGDYIAGYETLIALNGHKDSADIADSIYVKYKKSKFQNAAIGDSVTLGTYEQDNDESNGPEEIEWLVLDKQDSKVLVISKYCLDDKPFNERFGSRATWETCSLRHWLNNDFIKEALSEEESAMIPKMTVSADKNPAYDTNPGNATKDKVFLISYAEGEKYLSSSAALVCKPTAYARAQGVRGIDVCEWWLRTPCSDLEHALVVETMLSAYNTDYVHITRGVRPAMWINFEL